MALDRLGFRRCGPDLPSIFAGFGRSEFSTSLTNVPEPTRDSTRPSAISRSNASMTVVRDTPKSRASVRLAGRRAPAAIAPDSIRSRNVT